MFATILCSSCTSIAMFWILGNFPSLPLLLTMIVATPAAFLFGNTISTRFRSAVVPMKSLVIYGANDFGIAVAERLAKSPNIRVVGFLINESEVATDQALPFPIVGTVENFSPLLPDGKKVDGVIVAVRHSTIHDFGVKVARDVRLRLRDKTISVFVPSLLSLDCGTLAMEAQVGPLKCISLGANGIGVVEQRLKRGLDFFVASLALIVFAPLLLVCMLIIKLESPGPMIYRQQRFTKGSRLFECYKLRTMYVSQEAEKEVRLTLRNDSRVTRFGAFLRRTSLDELPQLVNVLQGHMSVVGPRPHPPGVKAGERLYEDVIAEFGERYTVMAGITGWAQVSGLRGNTFNEGLLHQRFKYDLEYIRNWSFSLELLILVKTVYRGFWGKKAF